MNCAKHGDYQAKCIGFGERSFHTRCPTCQTEKAENEEKTKRAIEAADKTARIKKLLGQAAIPPRFQSRTFDNFRADTEAKKQALSTFTMMAYSFDDCLAHGTSLLLCGKPGTGKSHLSTALAIAVINQGRSAVYTTVLRAVRSIKDTYRKDSELSEQQAINALISPSLLILDEVGVQFGTETEKMYLFEILNGRYENQKPTIVITNLTEPEATAYLGERIVDRLKEGGGGTLVFNWESYRSKVAEDTNLPTVQPIPVDWVNRSSTGMRTV